MKIHIVSDVAVDISITPFNGSAFGHFFHARNIIFTNNMDQDDFVIFAELDRNKFDEIVQILRSHFEIIRHGRQGDDWIWIHLADDKIEIDSFFSMDLEVKGKYKHTSIVKQILQMLRDDCIIRVFDPPKIDTTR